jgi:ribosome biogenesis protein YTM1
MHPQRNAANQGAAFLATGSKDNTLKVWSIQSGPQSTPSLANLAVLKGHINSVECVDFWETSGNDNQRVLLSGDWSGNIFGWNLATVMDDDAGRPGSDGADSSAGRKAKKQKGSKGGVVESDEVAAGREIKPAFTIRAHAQAVSGLQARGTGSAAKMFSFSWDHSLKEWDLERQDCLASFAGSKVITSLDYSAASGLLVTAHPDGRVRLWDPRKKDEIGATGDMVSNGQAQVGTFFSGKDTHWVSQAKFHPTNVQIFASCDYDGAVRVWDTRAAHVPLGSTAAHEGKALCVEWLSGGGEARVLSGGSDCTVRTTTLH